MQGKAALHDLVRLPNVSQVMAADRCLDDLIEYVNARQYGPKVVCTSLNADSPDDWDRLAEFQPNAVLDLLPPKYLMTVVKFILENRFNLVNTLYVTPELEKLQPEVQARGITILPEFGLDPGIDLVLLGEAVRHLDQVNSIAAYGAGLPVPEDSHNPLRYKVTWTFEGVLRGYQRGGKLIRHGKVTEIGRDDMFRPENIHEIEIPGLGRLEAYPNGDALRYCSALKLNRAELRHLGRYTCRYPGHCDFWRRIIDLNLLRPEPVTVDGISVNRRKYLASVIEPLIRLNINERDLALVRIAAEGTLGPQQRKCIYQVMDQRDPETGLTAMSRTVGFTAAIGAQMIASGAIRKTGILSPVTDVPFEVFRKQLANRGINVETRNQVIGDDGAAEVHLGDRKSY